MLGRVRATRVEIGVGPQSNAPGTHIIPGLPRTEGRVRGKGRASAKTILPRREFSAARGVCNFRAGTAAGASELFPRTAKRSDRLGSSDLCVWSCALE